MLRFFFEELISVVLKQYELITNFVDFVAGPSNLYKVNGLMPKTVYIFRARARNLAGYSDHSNLILLQTSAPHAVRELLAGSAASSAPVGVMQG